MPANSAPQLDPTTKLAYIRTWLAYERTTQAWIRTSASLITFGFGVYKLVDVFDPNRQRRIGAHQFGILLVCLGFLALVLATLEQRRNIKLLKAEYGGEQRSLSLTFAALVGIVGVFALAVMLFRP